MFRLLLILAVVTLIMTIGASELCAQEPADWPGFEPDPAPGTDFRGPGGYLSWGKILACWLAFLVWVRSTDWVSRDAQEIRVDFNRWNPIIFGTFMGAFVLVWLLPSFWIGFCLLVIALVAPLTSYVVHRQSKVAPQQIDSARESLCGLFAQISADIIHLAGFAILLFPVLLVGQMLGEVSVVIGVLVVASYPFVFIFGVLPKVHDRVSIQLAQRIGAIAGAEKVDPHVAGPPVVLAAWGGASEREDNVRVLAARQAPGFHDARLLIADGLACRADAIMLDYALQSVSVGVRWMIDGVWHSAEPLTREGGDPLLEALKTLCGLNPQDRRSQQIGTFSTEYQSTEYLSTLVCQGTKTGERAVVELEEKKVRFSTFEEIGLRPKRQEQLKELVDLKGGFLLFSALPAGGLRSTANVVLRQTDRFTREFVAVEEQTKQFQDVENCQVTTYNAAEGESPDTVLPKVIRELPDVIVVPDLVNAETVGMLCQEIPDDRLIIGTVRAKDCAEALLRVLALGVPADEFSEAVSAVFGQRLVRKLCKACKEAYTPPPQTLKQLGIPEGRVQALYRPPQQPEIVCGQCSGIGYKGRTAIFEILKVGDTVRKVLATGPKLDLLRQAARKDGMRSLREEGILLAAKGVTSLAELTRVFKQ